MSILRAFGDSLSSGFTPAEDLYVTKIADHLDCDLENHAVSGSQAADQSFLCYGVVPNADDIATILVGVNDVYGYGANTLKREQGFVPFLRALIARNALPDRVTARSSGMSYFGSWSNSGFNGVGKLSSSPWDPYAAACYVSGTAIYIFGAIHNASSSEGKVDVKVDGTVIGSIETHGTAIGNTSLGQTVSPACWRFAGLSPGSHLVQLISANNKTFFLDEIAGSEQSAYPAVYVGDISRRHPLADYDLTTQLYCGSILTTIHELRSDGLNVTPFAINSAIDPVREIYPDGIHWNSSGQTKAYQQLLAAIGT